MSDLDSYDPVTRGYRRMRRTIRNLLLLFVALALMSLTWGLPAIQSNYRAYHVDGIPTAMDKIDADYWNPFTGWRVVDAGEYAAGCPFIVFIPLRDCMDLEPYRNPITTFLLPDTFFQAP